MSIKVLTRVWESSQTKGSVLLLMLAIADYAHDDGTGAYPSIRTLAKKTRMTEQNVMRLVDKAEASGELIVKRGRGRGNANEYTITLGKPNKILGNKSDEENLTIPTEKVTSPLVQPLDTTVIEPIAAKPAADILPVSGASQTFDEQIEELDKPTRAALAPNSEMSKYLSAQTLGRWRHHWQGFSTPKERKLWAQIEEAYQPKTIKAKIDWAVSRNIPRKQICKVVMTALRENVKPDNEAKSIDDATDFFRARSAK